MGILKRKDDAHNHEEMHAVIESYLLPADIKIIRCVDDRQYDDNTNGVEIPGGIYGILDGIKSLLDVDEATARNIVIQAGIPISAHVDRHHGPNGCGYANLVEKDPSKVHAPDKVKAQNRLAWVRSVGGQIVTALGEHKPTHAVINDRYGYSIDPDQAHGANLGIFNYDVWAAEEYGRRILEAGYALDPQRFASHLLTVYKSTVGALSPIRQYETFT